MEHPKSADIRSVFPDWPSELEVAKVSGNWGMMAQSFYCAANVLASEYRAGQADYHENVGFPIDEEAIKRISTIPAQFFCMAFALELAVKAALVAQGELSALKPGDKLPFGVHDLKELASSVRGIELSPDEFSCLGLAADLISVGKYPVGIRPTQEPSHAVHTGDYSQFESFAGPLYMRFIDVAIRQSDNTSERPKE